MAAKPRLERIVRLELADLDVVDSRAVLAGLADVLLAHLPHPEHAVALQPGPDQVDAAIFEPFIEVAAAEEQF